MGLGTLLGQNYNNLSSLSLWRTCSSSVSRSACGCFWVFMPSLFCSVQFVCWWVCTNFPSPYAHSSWTWSGPSGLALLISSVSDGCCCCGFLFQPRVSCVQSACHGHSEFCCAHFIMKDYIFNLYHYDYRLKKVLCALQTLKGYIRKQSAFI